ncbi:unnamed protein product [Caenorhabditis auriculariae]|uniref:6-pyruvoyltetrahydropterin synthase n=1 Tax=Caenorhabditis auriculariae TaxID=2777116 RepID=A0A8S1GM97_9PELO|nr:unnamed protein product [Caenorhabditis auriculariae]
MSQPVVEMTRVEMFSACHRLHSKELSDAENREIYGKCNHINGHGHNYVWRVTLRGPTDSITGMVYDLAALKKEMASVLENVDHRNLDADVDWFQKRPSTSENVAIYLWDSLRAVMAVPEALHRVTLEETPKNIFSYSGQYA